MMRRIFVFWMVILCGFSSIAQFRKRQEKTSTIFAPPTAEATLNYANPSEYFIAGIDITGLNVLDKNALISLTGLKIGDKIKIPGDHISTAIRKLWKHG